MESNGTKALNTMEYSGDNKAIIVDNGTCIETYTITKCN